MYTLPKLTYSYDALEPYIDQTTMEIHHTKHHQTYIDKLNAALEKYTDLQGKAVEDLISDLSAIPEDIRTAVRNHGGGHANHSFFWPLLKKGTKLNGTVAEAIQTSFGLWIPSRSSSPRPPPFCSAAAGPGWLCPKAVWKS